MDLINLPIRDAAQSFLPQWSDYYQAVVGRSPRETLLSALKNCAESRTGNHSNDLPYSPREAVRLAVDLGCGDGRDTVELLRQNWLVFAIGGEPEAIARLQKRQDIDRTNLVTQVQKFETLALPNQVDLINASFCLPFCPPSQFQALWEKIVKSLRPGGRFCGQLFGDRDSWAAYPNRSHHTRSQLDQLLTPFNIEFLEKEEHPGITALGEEKYWHIYNIVARRKN
ncbi:MAG: class I SAM-dependent methyltransferase [Cyanobacteria bacterium J06581_3]